MYRLANIVSGIVIEERKICMFVLGLLNLSHRAGKMDGWIELDVMDNFYENDREVANDVYDVRH